MATQYSKAFVEQALVKAFSRGERTITAVAQDLNLNHHTLRKRGFNRLSVPTGFGAQTL